MSNHKNKMDIQLAPRPVEGMSEDEQIGFLVKLFGIPVVLAACVGILCVIPWGTVGSGFVGIVGGLFYVALWVVAVLVACGVAMAILSLCAKAENPVVAFLGLMLALSVVLSMFGEGTVTSDDVRIAGEINLRNSMKDPSSFRKVGSEKVDGGSVVTYRAKNGFGATVTERAFIPH